MKKFILVLATFTMSVGLSFGQSPALVKFFDKLESYNNRINVAMATGDNSEMEAIYMDIAVMYEQQPSDVRSAAAPMIVGVWYNIACYRALQGDKTGALEALEKSVNYGWNDYSYMMNDSDLSSIRNTPKFNEIAAKVKK